MRNRRARSTVATPSTSMSSSSTAAASRGDSVDTYDTMDSAISGRNDAIGRLDDRGLEVERLVLVLDPGPLAEPPVQVVVALGGRADGTEAADHPEQVGRGRADQLDEELLLALEVLVERRARDAGRFGDVLDARAVQPLRRRTSARAASTIAWRVRAPRSPTTGLCGP